MRFTKMHGIGNDYVYINCFEEKVEDPSALSLLMSRPHFGVGADGLVLISPSEEADCEMRVFNSDGSEADMCGNGIRCVGKYVREHGITDKDEITVFTKAGLKKLQLTVEGGRVTRVRVDMGEPRFRPEQVPVTLSGDRVVGYPLNILGEDRLITCVNVGNPHAVIFVNDPLKVDLPVIGGMIEHYPLFPRRTNVDLVRIIRRDVLEVRGWERGAGETLASGTGACAALAAAVVNDLADRKAQVKLSGGNLQLEWDETDGHIYQSGPAAYVFEGEWLA